MPLTGRRKEFLQIVLESYQQLRQAVHYTDVARALGVSRWTAYDILRRLERDGYLEAVYETGREERGPGRTLVLYRPTAKSKTIVGKEHPADWSALRTRLLRFLKDKKRAAKEMVAELLHEFPGIQERLAKCASNLAVLITHLEETGMRGRRALAETIARTRQPVHGLNLFTGAAMGSLLRVRGVLSGPVGGCVKHLQSQIAELNSDEASFLASFVKEGLER